MQIRRRFARWNINHPAKMKLKGAYAFAPVQVRNISLKGMQIASGLELDKDKFLHLSLVLEDKLVLELQVWVAWHKTVDTYHIYGLYFTQIQDSDKDRVYRFIRARYPKEINKLWWKDPGEEAEEEVSEDKRIFDRFAVQLPMKFIDCLQNHEVQARTCDINARGIGMISDVGLACGTPLEIWLTIPDQGGPLYTRGKVVWSDKLEPQGYRMGVELEKADLMGISRVMRAI